MDPRESAAHPHSPVGDAAGKSTGQPAGGLVLAPFRAVRPVADGAELARLLCPPYDVIDEQQRGRLLAADPRNAVGIVLPEGGDDRYQHAAQLLEERLAGGSYAVDPAPRLYVYEMRTAAGHVMRGLVGAVELRDPADGVILPHENTMAGPVADRLALMRATAADVEPIYLVYDGGGRASEVLQRASERAPVASCTTPDGVRHQLWAISEAEELASIADDLTGRQALIADGHHRYATYRALQAELRGSQGAGPWDYGLTLLVDTRSYGPEVHAIHRYVVGLAVSDAAEAARAFGAQVTTVRGVAQATAALATASGFAAVVTDGSASVLLTDPRGVLRDAAGRAGEPAALSDLDVTVLHRGLLDQVWQVSDDEETVGYAHEVADAIEKARAAEGAAVLLRPTPVETVAAVAAAGARMPRKSTSFTPKPASGLVIRRFADC